MPTRAQVVALLDDGLSYEEAGWELRIPAGQAYMIATGVPADGSDTPHTNELKGRPVLSGTTQPLVNPPAHNPTRDATVVAWVRRRAARELRQDP